MFKENEFESINRAYNKVFQPNKLSIGLVSPIESYTNASVPNMTQHIERIQEAESLGFAAIWLRDIPFNVPSFGDAGQMYDPFVYLGYLAAKTERIALGVGSLILPLRHPAHIAKSAASVDQLSNGRLLLGVASGDRPEEYPAMNIPYSNRGEQFRENFEYIEKIWQGEVAFENAYGSPNYGLEVLPKPTAKKVPLLITGASQQNPNWLASHGQGWITYPRNPEMQAKVIKEWRTLAKMMDFQNKPVSQSLYIDLLDDPNAPAKTIHLGYQCGTHFLVEHLKALEEAGVNHVVLNLRFNQANIEKTLKRLAKEVLALFHKGTA